MAEAVRVWVKTPVLETILHGKTRATKRRALPDASNPVAADDSGFVDWGWARGTIVRDDSATKLVANTPNKSAFSDKETIKVEIDDEESEYHRKTFDIPPDLSKDGVVMDNVWADSDDEDDSMGGGGGDFDEPSGPPDDLINLTHLHEPAVVYCLRKRYHNDEIYTSTGPILLALNPFKNCQSLYSDKAMMEYSKAGEMKHLGGGGGGGGGDGDDEGGGVGDLDVLPPHVYGIADHSFRSMMSMLEQGGAGAIVPSKPRKGATEKGFNQSILVSGESGAGKTVTTKFIMKYLATLSQRGGAKKVETDDSGGIERQVLQSNPILESFGNARTIRNDNSSRFGKFIELAFTNSGVLVGASIDTYLLEKVRLVTQMPGERNYHIFYELLVGLEEEECEKFFIGEDTTAEDFKMTNASGTYDRRDGVDDFDTYADLRNAMDTMGFEKEEQDDIMRVTCAVLHLSNAKFNSISADESEIDRECDNLQAVLALLGVDADTMNKALCYFTIVAGKEKHSRSLSKEKAEKGMLALIKATYGALFTHIVQRVNSCITVDDNSTSKRRKSRGPIKAASIGVLDIFGFESFKKNSFEQLCINYCNEALQQQFNLFVLKNEQDEYEREGIQWSFISFPDNQDVLDLIFKKGQGILNILDDQCRAPGTTDKTFANDLYQKCTPHSRFEADFRQVGARLFGVVHYAGCVEYDTEGFVEKNRDELPRESTDLLLSSSKPFVRKLAEILGGGAPGVGAENSPSPSSKGRRGGPRSAGGGGGGSAKRSTVGAQFSAQLTELRNKIDLTSPHYVRCLKPNDLLVPDHFDPAIIADQLRCAGVIEAVRVSRVGYPQRYSHQNFVKRYKILAIRELKKAARSSSKRVKPCDVLVKAIAKKILKVDQALQNGGHLPEGDDATVNTTATSKSKKGAAEETIDMLAVGMQVGKTKVFLRRRAYEIIERLRLQKMDRAAIQIQRVARRYIAMFNLRVALRAITLLQCLARSASARVEFLEKRRNNGVTLIANARRKHVARRTFLVTLFAARWMQKVNRGRMGRAKFDKINREHKSITIQTCYRRYYLRQRFRKMVSTAWMVQCAYRCHVAKIELKGLKATARDMGAVTEERDELKLEVQQLRKELSDTKRKAKADSAQVSAAAAAANDLKIARQEAAEMNKLKEEIEKITLERDEAWQKYKDQTDKFTSLETTLSDKAAEVKQQKEVVKKMKKELVGAGKASQALKASLTEDTSKLENTIDSLKTQLKESNDAVANASEAAATDMEEVQRLREELDCATDELEGLRSEMDDARNKLADTETELNDAREEASAAAVNAHPAASNGVSSEELELLKATEETLKKETDQLREEISKAKNATADIEIKAKAQVEAAEKIASQLGTELEDTKQKLEDAEKTMEAEVARAAAEATEAAATSQAKALSDVSTDMMPNGMMGNAEVEVDYLQNEIMRLEKELSDTKEELENGTGGGGGGGGGMVNNDPNSQEHLIARYEELRRLSDANLQKDQEIEAMKREIESLKVELNANGIANYNNYGEDDEDGASSLGFNDVTNPRNDENDPFFTAGPAGGRRKSPSLEASDKTALQAVNDMLRMEVEQLRVDLAAAQEKAKEEAENSARDLEAFSEALRGVDEMRRAAEGMSRELNKRRRKKSSRGEHWDRMSDRDDVSIMSGGTELFNEARKIIDNSHHEEKKINAIWARVKATVSMSSVKEDDRL